MSAPPFFTILTASYNRGGSLGETLASVRDQSFQDLEHIVIDGGSTDRTLDVLARFDSTYPLIWRSEPDRGIGDALNKGLALSRGRYVIVLHADDRFLAGDRLEAVYRRLRSERFDIHSFPVVFDDPVGGRKPYRPIRLLWWYRFKTIIPHQGCFVHRRVFERIGGFREELTITDYDFFYRAFAARSTVRFERLPVALMGGGGISASEDFLLKRLAEERAIQELNEPSPFWRIAQRLFRTLYVPYKTMFLPRWKKSRRGQSEVQAPSLSRAGRPAGDQKTA